MTVGELISALGEFDSSLPILLSSDAEGNSFGYVADVWSSLFVDWGRGEVELLHPDDYEEGDRCDGTIVVIYPI